MGVIGITHPRIGQKWPSMGEGLQLDPNSVESLRRMRRGKEGRVLWAPIHQHEPCCFLEFGYENGRIEILNVLAPKGYWLWCCVYHLLLGNPPSP